MHIKIFCQLKLVAMTDLNMQMIVLNTRKTRHTAEQQFSAKDSKFSHYSTCKVRPQGKGIQNLRGLGKLEAVLGPHFRRNALTNGLYIT